MYLRKFSSGSKMANVFGRRNFSFMDQFKRNSTAYRLAKYDPLKELDNHKPEVHNKGSDNLNYQISRLTNGMTIITEETSFPTNVHMGILLNVGSRDETAETSGACLAIKNTYMKTLKHTNETINYLMTQMSGGETSMEYDEENIFYHTYCFEYDATDMFRMIADMAFEPRSILAANVARDKNKQFHKLQEHLHHYNPFGKNPQYLLTTAFGYNTLGMPKHGFESNIDNVDAKMLQDFQLSNITPEKVTIVANGIQRHKEFVDLVNYSLGALNPVRESDYTRTPSQYIGGEYRQFTETPETNIILGYQSVPWTHPSMAAFAVMHTLFGCASGFSVGGPGKGMHNRAYTNIMRKKGYISSCEAVNLNFTDNGIFGLNFTGNSALSRNILEDMIEVMNGFRTNIDEGELNRAKNILKRTILTNLSNQGDRLEEVAKSYSTFGTLLQGSYLGLIDAVTSQDINKAAETMLQGKPTLVVTGNAVNLVPSIADIQGRIGRK